MSPTEKLPASTDLAHGALILVVEDDRMVREGLADFLEARAYQVQLAASAEEAFRLMQRARPDLILSDVMMPGMDGFVFYQTLRANPAWVNLPFIFLTALDSPEHIKQGNVLGADQYIVKPFDFDNLAAAIEGQITRHKTLEQVLRADVEELKRQLLTVFSHELRTPLTYIYGYVSLMQDMIAEPDPESLQLMLNGITRGAERLLRLVEELTLIVRIDAGVVENEIQQRRRPVAFDTVLRDSLTRLARQASENGASIQQEIESFLTLDGEPLYLAEIFTRVLENAIKFCRREQGLVRIEASSLPGRVLLVVADNGIGMDEEAIQGIFERFRQVDRELLEQQGLGLGLSIVADLVRLHGGEVRLSSAPGQGTRVEIELPSATD